MPLAPDVCMIKVSCDQNSRCWVSATICSSMVESRETALRNPDKSEYSGL